MCSVITKDLPTKILATLGAVLVWLPILAPILLSLAFFLQTRLLRFDFLMTAELFPFALVGGGLLVWAALRARVHLPLITWGFGLSIAFLVGSQLLAVITGLASGKIEPVGFWWMLVVALIAAYTLALLSLALGGSLLVRDLYGNSPHQELTI